MSSTQDQTQAEELREQIEDSLHGLTGDDKSAKGSVDYTLYLIDQYVEQRLDHAIGQPDKDNRKHSQVIRNQLIREQRRRAGLTPTSSKEKGLEG